MGTEICKQPTMREYTRHVIVCTGSKCTDNGEGQALYNELKKKLKALNAEGLGVNVIRSGASCLGTCSGGPLVCVQPDGIWYHHVTSDILNQIIEQHLRMGKEVTESVYHRHSPAA